MTSVAMTLSHAAAQASISRSLSAPLRHTVSNVPRVRKIPIPERRRRTGLAYSVAPKTARWFSLSLLFLFSACFYFRIARVNGRTSQLARFGEVKRLEWEAEKGERKKEMTKGAGREQPENEGLVSF